MSQAFKKKKQQSDIQDLSSKLNFLLGSQILSNQQPQSVQLERSLIIKSAMFWDSKSRIERIKSLMLSNLNLEEFDDVQDFRISQLTSIRQLSLSKNSLTHLQPLSILDTLVTLNISHNKVYNLAPLELLQNLEQLYASNNQITNIDPLKKLSQLRTLNLYKNKISKFDDTFATLQKLTSLDDLDIEQNPFYCQQVRRELTTLPISRLNDQLISKSEKEASMSSSIINLASSCVINPLNVSMVRDTKSSFFNPSSKSIKRNKIKELQEKLQILQDNYSKIDDEFEQQIVKNVHLKTQHLRISQRVKEASQKRQDNEYKAQQIKLLKRKAKDLKENLFTKTQKGQLLRRLFQLETQGVTKRPEKKEQKKQIAWVRKFDSDDVIIVADDSKYLEEDQELAQLLNNNSNTLEELRRELQSMH